jgi:hypothetical protein
LTLLLQPCGASGADFAVIKCKATRRPDGSNEALISRLGMDAAAWLQARAD